MQPASIPAFRSSPVFCVTNPITNGPMEPPISPAMARSANSAVPPSGILEDEILMVPGHIIPTEKPHTTQPVRFKRGYGARAAAAVVFVSLPFTVFHGATMILFV